MESVEESIFGLEIVAVILRIFLLCILFSNNIFFEESIDRPKKFLNK
jgi:hypothetical protein